MKFEDEKKLRKMYEDIYEEIKEITGYSHKDDLALLDCWLEDNNIFHVYLKVLQIYTSDIQLTKQEREVVLAYRSMNDKKKEVFRESIKQINSDKY